MRTPVLALAASPSSPPAVQAARPPAPAGTSHGDPPAHHQPPPIAWPEAAGPDAVRRRHLRGSRRQPVSSTPTRTGCRPSRSTSTRRPTRIAQRYVDDGYLPDRPASGSRSGSTPSTRATRRPTTTTFAIVADGGPTPFTDRRRGPPAHRPAGPRRARPRPQGRGADVRDRHVRLDGARGPPRAGQGRARAAGRRARPRRHGRPSSRSATTRRVLLEPTRADGTRPRSSARSTSSNPAARPTSRPACGWATSWPARR